MHTIDEVIVETEVQPQTSKITKETPSKSSIKIVKEGN